jgi:hypothetical protein
MSAIKKIFEFVINNKDANKDIQETKKNITGVTEETQKLGKESGKNKEKYGSLFSLLEDGFGSIKQTVKDFGNASMDVWNGAVNQGVKFAKLLSSALPAGFKVSSLAAKGFAVALAATGITLITAAVATLISYFKNFEGAVKMVDKTIAVLKETMYVVIDAFTDLLTLDFTGFSDTVSEAGDRISDAASAVDDLYDAQKRYAELNKQSTVDNAKLVAEQERLVKVLDDTTLSTETRMAAAVGLDGINKQLLANDKALLATKREEIEAQLVNAKNYEEVRDLKQKLSDITAEEIENESKLSQINQDTAQKKREIAESEEATREKEIAKIKEGLDATEKARIANLESEKEKIEAEFQMTIEGIRKKYGKGTELEKQLTIAKNTKLKEIEEKEEEKAKEKEQKILDKIKDFGDKETKTREEVLRKRAKAEKEVIDSSESLSEEEKTELKLEAETRLKDGLIDIEEGKLKKLQEIKNKYLPDADKDLTPVEKFEKERERKKKELEIELEDSEVAEKKKAAIIAQYDKETVENSKKLAKEDSEYSKLTSDQKVGYVLGGVSSIISSLAEGSDAAKGFAIAESLYNTYQGITAALASKEPLPIKILNAAATAAAGFAAVNNIMSTNSDGSGSRGSVNRGGGARISQGPRFDTVGDSEGVRNAQNEESRDNTPRETYVVSGKITNQQDLDRNKQNNSRFV